MRNTGIATTKTRLIFGKNVIVVDIFAQTVINDFYKYLPKYWQNQYWSIIFTRCLLPFWCTGTMFPFSQPSGNTPFLKAVLKITSRGIKMESLHKWIILLEIPSQPCAMLGFRSLMTLRTSPREIKTSFMGFLHFTRKPGRELPLSKILHWFAKKYLPFKKQVLNLLNKNRRNCWNFFISKTV